jgi:hypothetical protein
MDVGRTSCARKSTKSVLRPIILAMHVAIFVAWMGCPNALACWPGLEHTLFFEREDLAHGIDAPAIVEVTITDTAIVTETNGPGYWTAIAHVEKVLKGKIDGSVIKMKVMWVPSFCDYDVFRVGARGIVVGTLDRDSRGAVELAARVESVLERSNRMGRYRNKRANPPI